MKEEKKKKPSKTKTQNKQTKTHGSLLLCDKEQDCYSFFSPCRHYGCSLESTQNSKHDHVLESNRFGMLVVYKLIHHPGTNSVFSGGYV